jgi:hypothetical protein
MESPTLIVTLAGPKLKLTILTPTVFDPPDVVVVTVEVVVVASVEVVTGAVVVVTGCVVSVAGEVVVVASAVVVVGVVVSSGWLSPSGTDVVVASADPGVAVAATDVDVDSVEAPARAGVEVLPLSVAPLQLAATSISSEPRTKRNLAGSMAKR